jgi:hypothetical protein
MSKRGGIMPRVCLAELVEQVGIEAEHVRRRPADSILSMLRGDLQDPAIADHAQLQGAISKGTTQYALRT